MIEKKSTLIFGLIALGIYFLLVGTLVFYFNFRHTQKPKHFVVKNSSTKNEQVIKVSLSSLPPLPQYIKKRKTHKKLKSKIKHKKHKIKKRVVKKKRVKKRVLKKKVPIKKVIKKRKLHKKRTIKKIVTKKNNIKKQKTKKTIIKSTKEHNTTIKKKIISTKSLFSNIKSKKSSHIKEKKIIKKKIASSSSLFDTLKIKKHKDKGIENRYLSNIEKTLKGWPAQSEYAGEKATVWLKIKPNGKFNFKILNASKNYNFNEGLKSYLKQLQTFGFGHHKGRRDYEINVEFIAKE